MKKVLIIAVLLLSVVTITGCTAKEKKEKKHEESDCDSAGRADGPVHRGLREKGRGEEGLLRLHHSDLLQFQLHRACDLAHQQGQGSRLHHLHR